MSGPPEIDGLTALAAALRGYLGEIEEYRSVCVRHEADTAVRVQREGVRLGRLFALETEVTDVLFSCVDGLPGWQDTPYWPAAGRSWEQLAQQEVGEAATEAGWQPVVTRGIGWDGRPMLVSASAAWEEGWLRVELILPPLPSDLPELPLRAVAMALRCHDELVPGRSALPLGEPDDTGEQLTVREYLRRAMPQNLWASQWLFSPGAEH